VLYVGRLGREKGVIELLHAAARSREPWLLKLVGSGPIEERLRRLAERLGIAERVRMYPFISEHVRLARWYASARAVVMPGAHETFGLVGFEAAACGASVVTCSTAPSAALMRGIVRTYEPGDIDGLLAAIEAARAAQPDVAAATALAARCSWGAAFAAETAQLERLAGTRRRLSAVKG
jgi:alpha-1,6-mannosyltransferase